jgi:serine/threonine protein kinase
MEPKENLVKLTDFGLTRASTVYSVVDSPVLTTMTIIPVRYVAPEILRNPNKYTEKSDVYSMGVLMWEACSYGQLPYSTLETDEAIRKRKLNDEKLPQPSLCGHQLWQIMNDCWHQDPSNRPTFKMLRESLPTLENKPESKYRRHQISILHLVKSMTYFIRKQRSSSHVNRDSSILSSSDFHI